MRNGYGRQVYRSKASGVEYTVIARIPGFVRLARVSDPSTTLYVRVPEELEANWDVYPESP